MNVLLIWNAFQYQPISFIELKNLQQLQNRWKIFKIDTKWYLRSFLKWRIDLNLESLNQYRKSDWFSNAKWNNNRPIMNQARWRIRNNSRNRSELLIFKADRTIWWIFDPIIILLVANDQQIILVKRTNYFWNRLQPNITLTVHFGEFHHLFEKVWRKKRGQNILYNGWKIVRTHYYTSTFTRYRYSLILPQF